MSQDTARNNGTDVPELRNTKDKAITSLSLLQQELSSRSAEEMEALGVPEFSEHSTDLNITVRSLRILQLSIGNRGRLHLFLESGRSPGETRRRYFLGHSEVVKLFSTTVCLSSGYADVFSVQFSTSLAGFMLRKSENYHIHTSYPPAPAQITNTVLHRHAEVDQDTRETLPELLPNSTTAPNLLPCQNLLTST